MKADLYDFDKTIFNGESGSEFYLFCLVRNPKIIRYFPRQIKYAFRHFVTHTATLGEMKEAFYACLEAIDADKQAELFWQKNYHRINKWFLSRDKSVATIVCSASPLFQIKPVCDRLGVDLIIATDIDKSSGKLNGENCKGEEKIKRIKKAADEYTIRDAYTDNPVSDAPLLSLATRDKYLVTNGKIKKL